MNKSLYVEDDNVTLAQGTNALAAFDI